MPSIVDREAASFRINQADYWLACAGERHGASPAFFFAHLAPESRLQLRGGMLRRCEPRRCGRPCHSGQGGWTESTLYTFTGGSDGSQPWAALIIDNLGNLYGTTTLGGNPDCPIAPSTGCGTIFQLTPSGSGWTESVLYTFQGGNDGGFPVGGLTFDSAGNLYSTTSLGGTGNGGTAFELTNERVLGRSRRFIPLPAMPIMAQLEHSLWTPQAISMAQPTGTA
jgi:uncharacterized repeat protein (TIGR03803 family)